MKFQWLVIPLLAFSLVAESQVRPGPYNPGPGGGGNGGRNNPPPRSGDGGPGRPVPNPPRENPPPRGNPPAPRPNPPRNEPPRHEPPRRPDHPNRPEPGRPGNPHRPDRPGYGRPEPRPPRRDYPDYPPRRPEPPRYPNPPRDDGRYGQATVHFNYLTRRAGGEWVRVNFYSPSSVQYIQAHVLRAGLKIHEAIAVTYRGDRFVLRELTRTGTYYAPATLTSENFNSFDQIIAIDLRVESMGGEADMSVTVHSFDGNLSLYPSRN